MSTPTSKPSQPDAVGQPTTEDLRRVVACFTRAEDVQEAGYVFGAEAAAVGDEAVIYSRGRYRAGIVTKRGRVNLTVTYTTATAIREAADPSYGWTEPARTTKAAKFADVAIRPTATFEAAAPDSAPASRRLAGPRQLDHHDQCVGCGAHRTAWCRETCPFETGTYRQAVLLRATAARLREHPAGVGYDIRGALFSAALDLVGEPEAAGAADEAAQILTGLLVDQWGPGAEPIRAQVVYRHGLFSDLPNIASSLYAAAARHDGIDFDADAFGEFPTSPTSAATATPPAEQPPARHAPDRPSDTGQTPVTTGCDAPGCRRPAANLLLWHLPPGSPQTTARCHTDTALFTTAADGHDVRQLPLAEGSYGYLDDGDGTQIATCVHCGHGIYLYPTLLGRPQPWRGHLYDETGRCPAGEERVAALVLHEPATTVAERDHARAIAAPAPLAVVSQQRLPHPNPHTCAKCITNRPTLLLTLSNRERVTVCRPHAARYPK